MHGNKWQQPQQPCDGEHCTNLVPTIIVSDSSSVGNLWSKVIKQDSIFNGKIASAPGQINTVMVHRLTGYR